MALSDRDNRLGLERFRTFCRWWQRWRLENELSSLDRRTRDELRLTPGSAEGLVRGLKDQPLPLMRVLERLGCGAHPDLKDLAYRRTLERTCAECTNETRCSHWLASGKSSGFQDFCPNAGDLETLIQRRH